MINEALYRKSIQLFNGYQNNNNATVQELLLYIFEGQFVNGVFENLTVTGTTTLNGPNSISGTLAVGSVATFEDSIIAQRSIDITLGLNVGDQATINNKTRLGDAISSGVVAELGSGIKRTIKVGSVNPGGELYILNEQADAKVIIGAGTLSGGSGTSTTYFGLQGEKIGFFAGPASNEDLIQPVSSTAPANLADAIAQIEEIKSALFKYNLIELV